MFVVEVGTCACQSARRQQQTLLVNSRFNGAAESS